MAWIKKIVLFIINIFAWILYIFSLILDKGIKVFNLIYSNLQCIKFKCKNCFWGFPINKFYGKKYVKIGEGTSFGRMAVLTAWDTYGTNKYFPKVKIGKNCNFGDYIHLTCINEISIGDNILTGRWVTITDNAHGRSADIIEDVPPIQRKLYSKGSVIIENNVWIGDKVTILPGVKIGENSIIAANAVVSKDVPAYSIAVGNPIQIIEIK